MAAFQMLVNDPGRLDVCTSMDKEPYTPWCVPLSAIRSGTSSISIPSHAMNPGQHTIFALLIDRQTHETSVPTATTFNVAFRQWKLTTQGGIKFTKTLKALEKVERMKANQKDEDERISILLIHDGHRMQHRINNGDGIDMPAYNFIDRGLLEAVYQQQQHGSLLHMYGPYGPGHDNLYNSEISLRDNVIRKWGSAHHFDAVLYVPPPWPDDTTSTFPSQVKELKHKLVLFRQAETSDTLLAVQRMNILGANILLGTYAHELRALSNQWKQLDANHYLNHIMLAHLPHCASKTVFQTLQHHNDDTYRDIDVLLTGTLNPTVYPGRVKWSTVLAMATSTSLNTVVLNHPGYVISNTIEAAKQLANYASMLQRAKIVIVTPSKYGRGLAKYVEAQMSGAMIVGSGNMPNERTKYFSSFVVNMNVMTTSSKQLLKQLKWWISHPEERHRKARIGHVHAVKQTWTHWLGWLHSAVVMYRNANKRGEWSPLSDTGMPPSLSSKIQATSFLVPRKKKIGIHRTNQSPLLVPLLVPSFVPSLVPSLVPLPSNIKVGTLGCVASDRIETFFPSTWNIVSLNDDKKEWIDMTWVCNPLPFTIVSFEFDFLLTTPPSFASLVNMYPNVWTATNNKTNYCLHVRSIYPTTFHTFFMPCYVLRIPSHQHELIETIRNTEINNINNKNNNNNNDNDNNDNNDNNKHNKNLLFLTKPSEGSGGRGIEMVTSTTLKESLSQFSKHEYAQMYLSNPMLLQSTQYRKFDFRVYALITSFSPVPMFWLHRNGFARLSTAPYVLPNGKNMKSLQNLVPHITNVHFQRNVHGYTVPRNQNDDCSKDTRSLECMLNAIAQERGIGGNVIRKKLQHVVGKSLLAALIPLTNNRTEVCRQCYQIFGIDVLIDSFGNPYVVELNSSPSIEMNNPIADGNVLKEVYRDTWGMVVTKKGRGGGRRRRSSDSIKEWRLNSISVAMLKNKKEEEQLIEQVDQWCNRGKYDLALPPLDDFEVVGTVKGSEWRLMKAVIEVVEVYEESELCVDF